jgi:hypothetical protein
MAAPDAPPGYLAQMSILYDLNDEEEAFYYSLPKVVRDGFRLYLLGCKSLHHNGQWENCRHDLLRRCAMLTLPQGNQYRWLGICTRG